MGWKSTLDITREQAIEMIMLGLNRKPFEEMSNQELEEMLYSLGYGDKPELGYYGYNFSVLNEIKGEQNER